MSANLRQGKTDQEKQKEKKKHKIIEYFINLMFPAYVHNSLSFSSVSVLAGNLCSLKHS